MENTDEIDMKKVADTFEDEMKKAADTFEKDPEWIVNKDKQEYPDNSVTFRVYYKGCSILATSRDLEKPLGPLVQKAMKGIDWALENGCKASWNEGSTTTTPVTPNPLKTKVCDTCGGTRTFKEGVNKTTGKPWAGWFCPNDQCSVEWASVSKK